MPKTSQVTVAGREYIVSEKVSGVGERWRKHLRESNVFQTLQSIEDVVDAVISIVEDGLENIERGPVIGIARIVPQAINAMVNSMDDINTLVYDYMPEMATDREWLRENAYDSEITNVFMEILKVNFPILGALELIRGLRAPGTSTNLPTMNGAIGTNKRMARSKSR